MAIRVRTDGMIGVRVEKRLFGGSSMGEGGTKTVFLCVSYVVSFAGTVGVLSIFNRVET